MALTNAEKAKRYRDRQKAKKEEELKQPTHSNDLFRKPFCDFFTVDDQISSAYSQSLELTGLDPVSFDDDTGPEVSTLDDFGDTQDEGNFFGASGGTSLGKAEVMIGCLLDAASDLAAWVNDYKKSEISERISEIEAAEIPDADARRAAFAKAAELNQILADLEKTVRWTLPVWKVEIKN